jgi:hypothetical protein
MNFKDGGAFDFSTTFEQIKERLYQAYSVAREHGQGGAENVDLTNVHLEQLPAYEAAREVDEPAILSPIPVRPGERESGIAGMRRESDDTPNPQPSPAPSDPPPGYEEAHAQPAWR